jgi:hypothetical protein
MCSAELALSSLFRFYQPLFFSAFDQNILNQRF